MAHRFDATLKDLVLSDLPAWLALLGLAADEPVRSLPADLSAVTAQADTVIGVGDPLRLVIDLEFQSAPDQSLVPRLLVYNAVLYHRYRIPVLSAVVLLHPRANLSELNGQFSYEAAANRGLRLDYEVMRLWERPSQAFLAGPPSLWPLALLGQMPEGASDESAARGMIHTIMDRLAALAPPGHAVKLLTATLILTDLRFGPARARQMLGDDLSYEQAEADAKALLDRATSRLEALKILLRLGHRKFGPPQANVKAAIEAIRDVNRLERMAEAVLDAKSWDELLATP